MRSKLAPPDNRRTQGRSEGIVLETAIDRLPIPRQLFGRETEINCLVNAFERVVTTVSPELVLVSGQPGIGKSSLVHALREPVLQGNGLFAAGKFDRYKRNTPYSAVIQAFTELVLMILAESQEHLAYWKERLQSALGANGQLIVNILPPLELIVGPQSPVPEALPIEAQNRFRMVFRQFIDAFAQKQHPLVLFLDDLQWVDSDSLALLEDLLTHPEDRCLLVTTAYRNEGTTPLHPLIQLVDSVQKAGTRICDIELVPLSHNSLGLLLSKTLRQAVAKISPLTDLIEEKTSGNPFYAIQFLTVLAEERLIALDANSEKWGWDIEKIHAKDFPDNVIDLTIEKLRRLGGFTLEAVKQLACLGAEAQTSIIVVLLDCSPEEVGHRFSEAIESGILLRTRDGYKFLHDLVQEAAYLLVPDEQKALAHLQIGRLLLFRMDENSIDENVFDVVSQVNLGAMSVTDASELFLLGRLNFQAGMKAKAVMAYHAARSYLIQAAQLLRVDYWSNHHDHAFAVHSELAECEYLLGDFSRANELFTLLFEKARTRTDRAKVCRQRIKLYQVSGRYDEAIRAALDVLRLFDVTFPQTDQKIQAAITDEIQQISANMRGRRVASLVDSPTTADIAKQSVIGLLVDTIACSYIARPNLFLLSTLKALNLSLKYGNTPDSCKAYMCYGVVLATMFGSIRSALEFAEMSLRLNEKFNDAKSKGMLLYLHGGYINLWHRHIGTSRPLLEQAFSACVDMGDFVYAGHTACLIVTHALEKNDRLDEILQISHQFISFATQSHSEVVYQTLRQHEQFIAALKGNTREPGCFDGDGFSEAECLAILSKAGFRSAIAIFHVMKQVAAFSYGQYAQALESAADAESLLGEMSGMAIEVAHRVFHALTLTALYAEASEDQQKVFSAVLQNNLKKLKLWADHCPENFLSRYALVSAEVARIDGRDLDAMALYDEAIRSAADNGFVQIEGLANELAARFYSRRRIAKVADAYLQEAYSCYCRWGAVGIAKGLQRLHPCLQEKPSHSTCADIGASSNYVDMLSIVKASQVISDEIILDKLLDKLVRILLEQGGAEKGYIALNRGEDVTVEVEAIVNEDEAPAVNLVGSIPVASFPRLPASVISHVIRTKERLLLDNLSAESNFSSDEYVVRNRPQSLLCLPLLRQTELIGLVYLENNFTTGTFTANQLEVLELLASQAAISLNNAQLFARR